MVTLGGIGVNVAINVGGMGVGVNVKLGVGTISNFLYFILPRVTFLLRRLCAAPIQPVTH